MTRRPTRQQAAVLALLDESDDFLSAQQVHGRLREAGTSIGLATVYRALQSLAADGTVDVRRTEEGEAGYRRCSRGHHHHLVCRDCGFTVEVGGAVVENWTRRVSESHGFSQVRHTVEISGTCRDCAS